MNRAAPLVLAASLVACHDDAPFAPHPAAIGGLAAVVTANATATDLGGIAGFSGAAALAINAAGQAVGFVGNQERAVTFGPPTILYDEGNGFDRATRALDINDAGIIAGEGVCGPVAGPDCGGTFAGPLPDGWLPLLPGAIRHFGASINNAGEVVGSTSFDAQNHLPLHATVWIPGSSGYTPVDLGTFNGHSIEVLGLAPNLSGPDRIIVGRYAPLDLLSTFYTPLMWRNGAWSELPTMTGGCDGFGRNSGQANDASDVGVIVGSACNNFSGGGPAVWENGSVRILACSAPGEAYAIAVTAGVPSRTLIVGQCNLQPIVWFNDGLGGYGAELLPLLAGDTEGAAFDVNATGQIVGYTRQSPFVAPGSHAVLWTYTPPPLANRPPVAVAGGPYAGTEGTAVMLNGSGSSDPDGDPLSYDWNFGDGSPNGSGATPSHTYADNGVYTVTLIVSDGALSHQAQVSVTVTNADPVVGAITIPANIALGIELNASASFTDAGVLDTHTARIFWGDGSDPSPATITEAGGAGTASGSHTYATAGQYTIMIEITDNDGVVGTSTLSIVVQSPVEPPITNPALAAIIAAIDAYLADGSITNDGVATAAKSLVRNADAALARGNTKAARNTLSALINYLTAQSGKQISPAAAADLVAQARAALETL